MDECGAVATFGENPKGRDFVCGDIHGCFDQLSAELARLGFRTDRDRLFSVGDLVDRGPDSAAAFRWLAQPWFHAVRGNHEAMTVDAAKVLVALRGEGLNIAEHLKEIRQVLKPDAEEGETQERRTRAADDLERALPVILHCMNGGDWLLPFCANEPDAWGYVERMARLPVAIEVATRYGRVGITHADVWGGDWAVHCDRLAAGNRKAIDFSQWSRRRSRHVVHKGRLVPRTPRGDAECSVRGIDHVFVGHNVVPGGPVRRGNMGFIDTGAVFRVGTITVVDIDAWIEQFQIQPGRSGAVNARVK